MDEISKAQNKVLMDLILDIADCVNQADYIRVVDVLDSAKGVLINLNDAAYRS